LQQKNTRQTQLKQTILPTKKAQDSSQQPLIPTERRNNPINKKKKTIIPQTKESPESIHKTPQ